MYRKSTLAAAVLCLAILAPCLQANNVFILPDGAPDRTVSVFDAQTLGPIGNFQGPAGEALDTLASPDSPVTYWTYGAATTDAAIAVRPNFTEAFSTDAATAARAGVVTPDGRRFLLLTNELRVFDTATNNEIVPLEPLDLGLNPIDVAVGPDSKYAYVLSSDSRLLTRVNLTTLMVEGTYAIAGNSAAVSVGPNYRVYVSAINQIVILNGTDMSQVGNIPLNGLPGKVYVTPDGLRGVATNYNVVTNVGLWVFNLPARSVAGTIPTLRINANVTPVVFQPKVVIASNERAFVTSRTNNILYEVSLDDPIGIFVYNVGGVGFPSNVKGAAVSNEMPEANFLFYADSTTLYRVDLGTDNLTGTPANITSNVRRVAFARQPSTDAALTLMKMNDGQSISVDSEAGFRPIIIRALDAAGRPVFDAPVDWSSVFDGVSIQNAMVRTNLQGIAFAYVEPGDITGQFTVDVTVDSQTETFTLQVGTGGGGGGDGDEDVTAGIFRVSGNGQLTPQQNRAFDDMVVEVRGLDGAPQPGAIVEWEIVSMTPGSGGSLAQNLSVTNDDGIAAGGFRTGIVPQGYSVAQTVIRASSGGSSVEFTNVTFPTQDILGSLVPAPQVQVFGPYHLEGKVGEVIENAYSVRISAASGPFVGQAIPNVSFTISTGKDPSEGPTATCSTEVLTDDLGIGTCDALLGGQVGLAQMTLNVGGKFRYFPNRTVETFPGDPSTIQILGGNNQSAGPMEQLQNPLLAAIGDASSNRLASVPVTWEAVTPGTLEITNASTVSDTNGRVSANIILGNIPGTHQVRLRAGTAQVLFNVTVEVDITGLVAVDGNNQSAFVNEAFATPLLVRLVDEFHNGVPGQDIAFTLESGSASVGSPLVTTNGAGEASVIITAGDVPGDLVIAARFGSLDPVFFNLTVRSLGPQISPMSFTNGASGEPGVVPGSIVVIEGPGIAAQVQGCITAPLFGPLPLSLNDVSVQFGPDSAPVFAPIFHVCNVDGQQSVAVQAPFELSPGLVSAKVNADGGSTTVANVQVFPYQPGIFETVGGDAIRRVVAVRPDGSYVTAQNPARRGEIIAIFVTGLGAVNPAAMTNATGSAQQVLAPVIVGINNEGVRVVRSEYATGLRGIYILFVEVPQNTAVGDSRPLAVAVVDNGNVVFGFGSGIPIQ